MIVVILQLLFDGRAVALNIVWLVFTASYLYNIKQASNTWSCIKAFDWWDEFVLYVHTFAQIFYISIKKLHERS